MIRLGLAFGSARARGGVGYFGGAWVFGRYGGTVGVVIGEAEALVDLIQEFLGKYVFVFFGQPVKLVGLKALFLSQIAFPKSVGPDHLQGFVEAFFGQVRSRGPFGCCANPTFVTTKKLGQAIGC